MVIHQHAFLLLCSCYPPIPQMIKFTSTTQHCRLYAASLSPLCPLHCVPLKLSKHTAFPFLLLSSAPTVSPNLATCIDSPGAAFLLSASSHYIHAPSALSLANTHTLRLLSTAFMCRPLHPPIQPPGFIFPLNISLLSLSLPLSRSRSFCLCL